MLGGEGAHLVDGAGLGDDQPRPGRGGLAVDLVRRAERVGRGGGGAEPGRAEEHEGELGAVAEQVHDHVALPHAQPAQPRRAPPGELLDLRVGVHGARLPVDEAGPGGHLRQPLEAVVLEREVGRDLDVREPGPEHRLRRHRRLRRVRRHGAHGSRRRRVSGRAELVAWGEKWGAGIPWACVLFGIVGHTCDKTSAYF